ncbi:hypothetical protein Ddye_028225 [Dipteronia dyeriana]|uniref:Uncharacterized protein n=1 Tax=Dipteronia dyeriana TaxID=168575 RepID=A0AAD9TQK0_9ROSI|nr:hypothetical protein Ddye_028225 [Dipteronia dyeriana]
MRKGSKPGNCYCTITLSFDHPTDTLLPGIKLGSNFVTGLDKNLSFWKSLEDLAPGQFSVDRSSPISTANVKVPGNKYPGTTREFWLCRVCEISEKVDHEFEEEQKEEEQKEEDRSDQERKISSELRKSF